MVLHRWLPLPVLIVLFAASARAGYQFVEFDAPYPHRIVRGIVGNLAFGYSQASGGNSPHQIGYWPNGPESSFVELTPISGQSFYSNSYEVSGSDGMQLVGWSGDVHATLWTVGQTAPLDLTPAGYSNGVASGVSNGIQVGAVWQSFTTNPSQTRAVRWNGTAASAVILHPAGYYSSEAIAVDGNHIVGSANTTSDVEHAALWTINEGTFTNINPEGYYYSYTTAVSGNQIVGVARPNATAFPYQHAMIWTVGGGVTDLNPAGFIDSYAIATNGTYQVGAGSTNGNPNDNLHLFRWAGTADSVVDLNQYLPPGFAPIEVDGINQDGVTVGFGTIFDPIVGGEFRSFALIPTVPEPTIVALLGVTSLVWPKRRSRRGTGGVNSWHW